MSPQRSAAWRRRIRTLAVGLCVASSDSGCITREDADHCANNGGDVACPEDRPHCSELEADFHGCVQALPDDTSSSGGADDVADGMSGMIGSGTTAAVDDGASTTAMSDATASDATTGPMCGNELIERGEFCEPGNVSGQDCSDIDNDAGKLACTDQCTFDFSGCSACGDEMIDEPEQCDGPNLGGNSADCTNYEDPDGFVYLGGMVECLDSCNLSFEGCVECSEPGEPCVKQGDCCPGIATCNTLSKMCIGI